MSQQQERQEVTAEGELAGQLGTDKTTLVKGKFDMRRLSKINPIEKAWISFFMLEPEEEGGDYFREFCENYLNLSVSEDGWRTNKMIQMVAGSKGAPSVGDLMKRPGWLSRNLMQRDWEKKAEEDGATVVR